MIHPSDNVDAEIATELPQEEHPRSTTAASTETDDGVNDLYPHSKYLLINGVYQGRREVSRLSTPPRRTSLTPAFGKATR